MEPAWWGQPEIEPEPWSLNSTPQEDDQGSRTERSTRIRLNRLNALSNLLQESSKLPPEMTWKIAQIAVQQEGLGADTESKYRQLRKQLVDADYKNIPIHINDIFEHEDVQKSVTQHAQALKQFEDMTPIDYHIPVDKHFSRLSKLIDDHAFGMMPFDFRSAVYGARTAKEDRETRRTIYERYLDGKEDSDSHAQAYQAVARRKGWLSLLSDLNNTWQSIKLD